jgi:hypothetical protein
LPALFDCELVGFFWSSVILSKGISEYRPHVPQSEVPALACSIAHFFRLSAHRSAVICAYEHGREPPRGFVRAYPLVLSSRGFAVRTHLRFVRFNARARSFRATVGSAWMTCLPRTMQGSATVARGMSKSADGLMNFRGARRWGCFESRPRRFSDAGRCPGGNVVTAGVLKLSHLQTKSELASLPVYCFGPPA